MEYVVKEGTARQVVSRYKAILDNETNTMKAVSLKAIYRVIGGVAKLVWELIRSCFGSGSWINDRPWNNADGWNNGT
jgi:hypothetical protein